MIKKTLLLFCIVASFHLNAQTGIGTTTPHASAKLEVNATNKGFLPPRVTLTSATDASTIASPAEGLLVYNLGSVGLQAGYYYWNGTNWATIATASSAGNGVTATDLVKLYGEVYSAVAGKIGHANGFNFTVPVSGKYLFDFSCSGWSNNVIRTMGFKVRQGTTDLGSDTQSSYNNVAHTEYNGKVEVNLQAGVTYNVYVTYDGVRDAGDYDRVYYKMVSGNLPVTGQSVDYVSTSLNANIAGVGSNTDIKLQQLNGGTIPYNTSTGVYSLSANKTYILQAQLRVSTASTAAAYLAYTWVDAVTNSELITNSEALSSSNTSGAGFGSKDIVQIIYTPTTNQTVKLRSITSVGTQTIWLGTASIVQIGSSAFVNPWILSGNNVYNTTGKVGIGTNTPAYLLDVNGTAKLQTTPAITTATNVLVKDPTTSQISEQPISFINGIAKFIRNTTQTSITNGTTVILNTTTVNSMTNYVSLNTATGVITLQPGTYELNGTSGAGWSANGSGDSRSYTLFHNGTSYIGTGGVTESGPAGNYNTMPQNTANCVIVVPVGQTATIALRLVSALNMGGISSTGDFGDVGDGGRAWVTVRKYN